MKTQSDKSVVTILGSGTCVPSLTRSACSVLIEVADTKLLFDSGPGTMRRLLECETKIFDISHLFYSHFHPDHTAELVPFLFATKYPDGSRRKIPLTIVAGRGFIEFFNGLKAVYGTWIELPEPLLKIKELSTSSGDLLEFEAFKVGSCPVEHTPQSLAYRVTDRRGRSVVYSGDTDVSENLVDLARAADVFICECALPDGKKVKGHLTPALAGEIAARADVGRLVLTHFYPECDTVDIETQCRKTYTGPLTLAQDLMKIELD